MTIPDLTAVKGYLGETSWSDDDIQDALDAETAAQAQYCSEASITAYPDDLGQALKRRTARNLAMRSVQLGIVGSGTDTPMRTSALDAEVRRYERPYQKVTVM